MRRDPAGARRRMRCPRGRAASVTAALAAVVALSLSVGLASGASGPGEAFGDGSSYKTLTNPASAPTGFELPAFDDSAWTTATAPFGQDDGATCSGVFPSPPWNAAVFPVDGTVYLRKSFALPGNAFGLHVVGTIDNDADVYVNGTLEGQVLSGSCETDAIDLQIPNSDLEHGGSNLVAVKAVDHGVISFFDMHAAYGVLEFAQQPTETQKGSAITPAPTATITDADGNPVAGATVDVTLDPVVGTGAFTAGSTTEVTTGATGVATFSNLAVTEPGKYRLVATSEGASDTSDAFLIANQITACTGSSCSAEGSVPGSTTVQVSSSNAVGSSLAVSVFDISPPAGACDPLSPLGVGSFVNVLGSGGSHPDLTLTWRLDKSLVLRSGNPGASKFDICLGAVNLEHVNGGVDGWTTKAGGHAVPFADPDLGVTLYWGIAPDCPKKGRPSGPCVQHRNKNRAGDEVIDVFKPYPWDGRMYGG
jgi:hypothetical protein